jgi:hypothetical protein
MTTDPAALFGQVSRFVEELFGQMDVIDKIETEVRAEYPEAADAIFHAGSLCRPTAPLMSTPAVYEAHVRELLTRAAKGEDLRPGTDAEMACCFATVSPHNHLTPAGNGLYMRVFARVMPEQAAQFDISEDRYAYSIGPGEINAEERRLRRKLAQPWRVLGLDCDGTHHGDPAPGCRFAPAAKGQLF